MTEVTTTEEMVLHPNPTRLMALELVQRPWSMEPPGDFPGPRGAAGPDKQKEKKPRVKVRGHPREFFL